MKVIFCIPTLRKPYQVCLDSLAASVHLIEAAGWDHGLVSEVGSPYISNARATMLKKALDSKADSIVFIDHDLSWQPEDLLKLVQADGDFVVGTYRFKREPEQYMGQLLTEANGKPVIRGDGALKTFCAPAGFMKITRHMVNRFLEVYPELAYGDRYSPHVDLFNHGAYEHVWYGEDYSACRRWLATGGDIWTIPDLNINHHTADTEYKGNLHQFLMRQPGGSEAP
jgi:glycosyltransferase involved in cell wall biosynthesis